MKSLNKPCKACPWRKDAHAQDIPGFDLAKAESMARCCPDAEGFGPDFFAPVFACHQSPQGEEFPCAGWLAQVGEASPRIRIALVHGDLKPDVLQPGRDWPALHESYGEVIKKLRADCA